MTGEIIAHWALKRDSERKTPCSSPDKLLVNRLAPILIMVQRIRRPQAMA
jgi:hypothetical protein